MYGAYAGRRTRTHDHGGTVHACKPYGLHSRGVTGFLPEANIAEAGAKPLNSGGGGKCTGFVTNRFTSPERTGSKCR